MDCDVWGPPVGNNTPAKAADWDENNTNSDLITSHIRIFTPIPASMKL